ncbi:MAG: hypothetical protein ACTHN8_09690, partial [Angustibacter sp.]
MLTSAMVLLATALLRRWRLTDLPRPVLAGGLVVAAAVAEVVPFFSHSDAAHRRLLAHLVAAATLLAAAALALPGPRGRAAAALVGAAGSVAVAVATIVVVPAPRIDVWVTLQQAADGLA